MSVLDRLRRLVADAFQMPVAMVAGDTDLTAIADSLGTVELIMAIEEEFGIETPDLTELSQPITVADLAALIEQRLGGRE